MAKALLAALMVLSATASAQTPAASARTKAEAVPAPTPTAAASAAPAPADPEELRREIESARKEVKELREEMRAQLANQSAAQGWEAEASEEKRKLELFVPSGYFRVRPDLFNKFNLGRSPDPSGYSLFPSSPTAAQEKTMAGVNMRFRFEPTFNVSEEVRIKMQVDVLDNVIFGSNPEYAFSRGGANGYAYDRNEFTLMNETQVPPRSAINAIGDSIAFKRVYGEVTTPVGILRFGRMGSHWGLGLLHNDGTCMDCDHGDTVDRLMFVANPLKGFYITPMLDFDAEGPSSSRQAGGGQPFDVSNTDDTHSFILAIARRDTEQEMRAKFENNLAVFNYGVHFTYRVQRNDPAEYYAAPFTNDGSDVGPGLSSTYVPRGGSLFMPDLWLKFERRHFRFELEGAAILGSIGNRAQTQDAANNDPSRNQGLSIVQFGAVAQSEVKLLEGALKLGVEVGYASGDRAPGFGNFPRRRAANADGSTQPGDIDGPQYACGSGGGCSDSSIRNFRFNRDYRVDMILWREILGGVTDALYFKPNASYRIAEGFDLMGAVIYSRSIYEESVPAYTGPGSHPDQSLGIEINVGARYETEDGFIAGVNWGILFPLGGLADPRVNPSNLDTAQALRGMVGIRF